VDLLVNTNLYGGKFRLHLDGYTVITLHVTTQELNEYLNEFDILNIYIEEALDAHLVSK
jgi:hypothetical protein